MNENGVLVDRTAEFAPGFITTFTDARDVIIGDFTRADLEKIVKDEKSAPALVIAAQSLLDGMMDGKRYVLGKDGKPHATTLDPTPARVRVDIADRVEGKCVQSVHVHKTEAPCQTIED